MTLLMFIYYRYYRLHVWMETTRTPNCHNDDDDSCHHHHTYHTATPASHDPPSIGGFSYYINWGARDALHLEPQVYFFLLYSFLLY